jgi:hypothetical protein
VLEVLKKELVALRVDVTSLNRAMKAATLPSGGVAPLVVESAMLRQRQATLEAMLSGLERRQDESTVLLGVVQAEWRVAHKWVRPVKYLVALTVHDVLITSKACCVCV